MPEINLKNILITMGIVFGLFSSIFALDGRYATSKELAKMEQQTVQTFQQLRVDMQKSDLQQRLDRYNDRISELKLLRKKYPNDRYYEDQYMEMKRDLLERIDLYLINEKLWSGEVATKWEPPEGLFTSSAENIAKVLHSQSNDLKQAMSRLNFYINRAGDKLSSARRRTLEDAKELLRKKFGVKKKEEEK